MKTLKQDLRIFSLLLVLLLPLTSWAAAGKVVIAAGEVFAIDAQEQRRPLQRRSDIFEGDTLVTGADGRLQLRFEDNAILALRADSQLRISEYHGATDDQNERVLMDLLGGGFRTISGSFGKSERDAYQVRTPNASIGIRGTHYEAVFESETLSVGVYDGGIVLTNDQGSLNLGLDSEFVFAQVQAGNLPQGLLNPPANLNVPNTPESDDDSAEEGDEETTPDETNTDEPEDIAAIPVTSTDNNDFSTDDFNFSDLEDAFIELQEKSVVLSDAEREALNDPSKTEFGILVMAPSETGTNGQPISELGPLLVYYSDYTTGDPQSGGTTNPLFIAFESQDLSNSPTDVPNFVLRPDEDNTPFPGLFGWEEWNLEATSEATAGNDTGFNSGTVEQPFYYITAEPTQANLSGVTSELTLLGLEASVGAGLEFDGSLTANFDTGAASGDIFFNSTSGQVNYDWFLEFSGQVNDAVLNATLDGESSVSFFEDGDNSFALEGNVVGIFGGDGEQIPIDLTGGFTAEAVGSDLEAYGVFHMGTGPD